MKIKPITPIVILLLWSCSQTPKTDTQTSSKILPIKYLPFQTIDLKDKSEFRPAAENWKIVSEVRADRSKEKTLFFEEGNGILVNVPEADKKDNLFTSFEHGDIELEMDVMLASKSNSGVYLQGRYELQLLDSWGIQNPGHGDMGGIYQRWDDSKKEGEKGYEGKQPAVNAAKAPGLWQSLKIIFHAPRFNSAGDKIKNASFQKVWLNGVLIHSNVELTGPTRGHAFTKESAAGPLMLQGDHGPVAFKNIKYKRYTDNKLRLSDIKVATYSSPGEKFPDLDSVNPISVKATDSISSKIILEPRSKSLLKFEGRIHIPSPGDYLFDLKLNVAGGALLIDKDTIISMNGTYNLDSLGIAKVHLNQGELPFTLIYNKHLLWTLGFNLSVEGPQIEKHNLSSAASLDLRNRRPPEDIMVKVGTKPILQRSFLMYKGEKRTHCISVGTPAKVNYSYDLGSGTLLQAWDMEFLDATEMWHGRGEKQLAHPAGFTVSFHGTPDMAFLENAKSAWPLSNTENPEFNSQGYTIDQNGLPEFVYRLRQTAIRDKFSPSAAHRGLDREIKFEGSNPVYHKLAAGEAIIDLGDGTYIVNDESYYIQYPAAAKFQPFVREVNGRRELLLKIPQGEQHINYSIVW